MPAMFCASLDDAAGGDFEPYGVSPTLLMTTVALILMLTRINILTKINS